MFGDLRNLIEIDLSDFDASKVETMQFMLNGCSNLEKKISEKLILLHFKICVIFFNFVQN